MTSADNKLLLHSCCAPCTTVPLETYLLEQRQLEVFFYNPNIHDEDEYLRRLDTVRTYLQNQDVSLVIGPDDFDSWEQQVGIWGGPYPLIKGSDNSEQTQQAKKKRCRACYDLRLGTTAAYAAVHGYRSISTTLTISPYQFTEELLESLQESASEYGLEALAKDWRTSYQQSQQKSRALGMYRQKFCGCRFSEQEAAIERQQRQNNAN